MFFIKFIFIFVLLKESSQSHWRGGVVTWAPVNNAAQFPIASTDVIITQHYFDRYGFSNDDSCASPQDITNQNLVNKAANGPLKSTSGPEWNISAQVFCYSYSVEDNWQSGKRNQTQNIITTAPVTALFTDSAWISGIILTPDTTTSDQSYFFELIIDLRQRTDTGKINTSPSVRLQTSTIKLSTACGSQIQSFTIPVSDVDGDDVRCRCRNNSCHKNFIMYPNCTFVFSPDLTDPYGIYITVEDFAKSNPSVPLSSVPVVILALVSNNPADCCKNILIVCIYLLGDEFI